jgi:hypothetical protein
VLVAGGDLRVRGTIHGTAISIFDDIVMEPGGRVTGDAIAVLGNVRLEGGRVEGEARSYGSALFGRGSRVSVDAPPQSRDTGDAIGLALGWLVVMLVIEGVTDVLEQSFWRSFLVGVAGQLAMIPVLVLLVIALIVTLVGILLIPFAVVAYVVVVAGLCTLGFLAMAKLTGASIGRGGMSRLSERGGALRALILGIGLFVGMWVLAAVFQWSPIANGVLRLLAATATWVAMTAGFGAVILSRGGTRRDAVQPEAEVVETASWQTPTPVTGVVAARRPTPGATKQGQGVGG